MRLSVALCTFNGERYVAGQVESILRQTRPVDEIVVSDDASVDGTVAVIEETLSRWRLAAGRPAARLRVIRNAASLGVTANFEQALAACTGDLIALCDQDDLWRDDKIERMAAAFERRPELLLLGSNARMVAADGSALERDLWNTIAVTDAERSGLHAGRGFEVLMRRNVITGATAMVRRELIERAAPFPSSWVHDEWLAIVAAAIGELDVVSEPLIDYRQHGGNQIGATSLTGSGRVERLRTPRSDRNRRLLERAADLAERMPQLDAPPERQRLAEEKLEHEQARSRLPRPRIARVAPVVREWRTGRYASCGLGAQDVLRDLVQPV